MMILQIIINDDITTALFFFSLPSKCIKFKFEIESAWWILNRVWKYHNNSWKIASEKKFVDTKIMVFFYKYLFCYKIL